MFDVAMCVVLLVALRRSIRAHATVGVVASVASLVLLAAASASALASKAGDGMLATPFGVVFIGPTAILHDRTGIAALVASPLSMAVIWLGLSIGALYAAHRTGRELNPMTEAAGRLAGVETAFAGAVTFAGIRLVTVLLFHALTRDT